MNRLLEEKRIIFGDDHDKLIELKAYAHDYQEKLSSVIELDGRSGAYDLRSLFPEFKTAFKNPKPVNFLQRFISLILKRDGDTILDFYAGSSTTAHAILALNQNDGVARRFVMIQLPEACNADSEAAKTGIQTISKLSMERIRRAGRKILRGGQLSQSDTEKETAEQDESQLALPPRAVKPSTQVDVGFRVLKIDTSNMADVYYAPDAVKQADLVAHTDNIKPDRTPEDLLFQVLVDWGVDLSLPIVKETFTMPSESKDEGRRMKYEVFFVDGNALAACFDPKVSEDLVKELAKRKPLRAVFRDSSYDSDSVKINVEQIFKLLSPETEVKTL
jgi:adenine-specific DNA-methyltransferase